jgi:DNA-binding MarR family transcriptional regulator
MILHYVERHPGVRFHELKFELGLPHGVMVHHLRVLRQQGLLVWQRQGRRLHFRLPGQAMPDLVTVEAAQLLELVGRSPGISLGEASRELGWTRRKANYWAARLHAAGRLVRGQDGPRRRLHLVRTDILTLRAGGP